MTEPTAETSAEDATAPTDRIEVVGGGAPDAAQLAAVAVALTPTGGDEAPVETVPAWARASLLENVGHRRPQRPSDLDATLRLG